MLKMLSENYGVATYPVTALPAVTGGKKKDFDNLMSRGFLIENFEKQQGRWFCTGKGFLYAALLAEIAAVVGSPSTAHQLMTAGGQNYLDRIHNAEPGEWRDDRLVVSIDDLREGTLTFATTTGELRISSAVVVVPVGILILGWAAGAEA